jgi:hypothetical protein
MSAPLFAPSLRHSSRHPEKAQPWKLLDRSMPDWRQRQEELRQKAQQVYWCRAAMVT